MKKRGLGRGLDLIFAENAESAGEGAVTVNINDIEPNRQQPRKDFNPLALQELADSIAQYGVLQPLLLRPLLSGGYRIVAGERRWRAARMAGLSEVPAVIREMTDAQEQIFALIENLQREDLNPLEEANGYRVLIEEQGFSQDEVARAVGKSRPTVANALRLLNLPEGIKDNLAGGNLTGGQARALLSFENGSVEQRKALNKALLGASARELESMAKKNTRKPGRPKRTRVMYYRHAELVVAETLSRKVTIAGTRKKGTLTIEFYGEKDLLNLLDQLGIGLMLSADQRRVTPENFDTIVWPNLPEEGEEVWEDEDGPPSEVPPDIDEEPDGDLEDEPEADDADVDWDETDEDDEDLDDRLDA